MKNLAMLLGNVYQAENGEFISLWKYQGEKNPGFRVETNLCEPSCECHSSSSWDIAINSITCMILEQACSGIDVLANTYCQAVRNTIEQLSERYGDG